MDNCNETNTSIHVEEEVDEPMDTATHVVEKVDEPKVGMMIDSYDALYDFYLRYSKQVGFAICKRSCRKDENQEMRYVTLTCAREGKTRRSSDKQVHMNPVSKTDCKARIVANFCPDEMWKITKVELEHNHVVSPSKSRLYRCNRVIQPDVKRRLELNDKAGIRMNKIFNSLVVENEGHENLTFQEKDCRNYIDKVRRLRLGEGDGSAIHTYFSKMQSDNKEFFYVMDFDDDFRVKNVFWADARSRATCKEFGDVVTFDTTYLTNRYDMPFAPIVGVNHHGQSILLGCGLISNENVQTFTWLFQSWLVCMDEISPTAIITDQDMSMKQAVETVFPGTRHRWCLWHIMKKIPEKLGAYKDYKAIKKCMKSTVYNSLTILEFEESWQKFIASFTLKENRWLTGLYNERNRWVPAFVKDTFWAGMSTTQRSESMNAFFDGYVNSKTSLKQFVEQYENALRSKAEKETDEDFKSFNSRIPCITKYEMERQFQMEFTSAKFKEFQEELLGKINCNCSPPTEALGNIFEYDVGEDLSFKESIRSGLFQSTLS